MGKSKKSKSENKYVLRDYQNTAVIAALNAMEHAQDEIPVISLPTGSGKSLVIANIIQKFQGQKVLVLQPNKEILEQNFDKYTSGYGFEAGIYSASKGKKELQYDTIFATIGSIYKCPHNFQNLGCIIIDEVHNVGSEKKSMYKTFFEKVACKNKIGLTATPFRTVSKTLIKDHALWTESARWMLPDLPLFSEICCHVPVKELIDKGYLLAPKYYTWNKDFDETKMVLGATGEFTVKSLEKYTCSNRVIEKIISAIVYCMEKRSKIAIYASSHKQTALIVDECKKLGIDLPTLQDDTPPKERDRIISKFREDKKGIICQCLILKEGFDCGDLDCVIYCRPTRSVGLYIQIVGRLLRIDKDNPNKDPVFCDCTGAYRFFGKMEDMEIKSDENNRMQLFGGNGRQLTGISLGRYKIKDLKGKNQQRESDLWKSIMAGVENAIPDELQIMTAKDLIQNFN